MGGVATAQTDTTFFSPRSGYVVVIEKTIGATDTFSNVFYLQKRLTSNNWFIARHVILHESSDCNNLIDQRVILYDYLTIKYLTGKKNFTLKPKGATKIR